jgi:hypothetical protein
MKSSSKPTVPPKASAVPAINVLGGKNPTKKSLAKKKEVPGKLGKVVALLKRPKGATLAELMKTTGWQKHSVRGAISGAIKKKLKRAVLSEKVGDVRTYRIKG